MGFHQILWKFNHILVLLINQLTEDSEESLESTKYLIQTRNFECHYIISIWIEFTIKENLSKNWTKTITDLLAAPRTLNCKVEADLICEPAKRWITWNAIVSRNLCKLFRNQIAGFRITICFWFGCLWYWCCCCCCCYFLVHKIFGVSKLTTSFRRMNAPEYFVCDDDFSFDAFLLRKIFVYYSNFGRKRTTFCFAMISIMKMMCQIY